MTMDLFSAGTMKHVVAWKTRDEFLLVFDDLYSSDESLQQQAVHKINMWKSRAGTKLSVAIESSSSLRQAYLDYLRAKRQGKLRDVDLQLRSTFSLAIIRFVNHITEKGQTKAVAQPVHIIAKEFDIPEWVVRLRHDATHSSLPSLDTLVVAATWALDYLKVKFWEQQRVDTTSTEVFGEDNPEGPTMSSIRSAIYDFQKARFQDLKDNKEGKEKDSADHKSYLECLKTLQKYVNQNRLKFLSCFLEDGILVSTVEQLTAFGVQADDLLSHLPPTIPAEMAQFWSPLLKKLHNSGCLPLLLQTILFSVTPQEGLRNYQLVAWLLYLLSQGEDARGRNKRKRKHDQLFKSPPVIPKKMLLTACLQNISTYTAFLLKHLLTEDSLGPTDYTKLTKLLHMRASLVSHPVSPSSDEDSDSEGERVYTVDDLKKAKSKHRENKRFSSATVSEIENSVEKSDIPWKLCTELVDWSTIPFGTIPLSLLKDREEGEEEDEARRSSPSCSHTKERKKKRRSQTYSSDENDDDREDYALGYLVAGKRSDEEEEEMAEDSNDSDDGGYNRKSLSKRTNYLASEDIL